MEGTKLLTAEEAGQILRVDRERIYEMAKTGLLPGVVRLGRRIRIDQAALQGFIKNGGKQLPGGWRREPAAV